MPRPEEAAAEDFVVAAADSMVAVADSMVVAADFMAAAVDSMAADFAAAPHFTADVDFTLAECAQVGVNSARDRAGFVRLPGHLAAIDLSLCTIRQTGRSGAMRA